MHIVAILNRGGGTLRTMDLDDFCVRVTDAFERNGHTVDCRIVEGKKVESALRAAVAADGTDAILAAGGDGTVSTAAAIAFAAKMPLGILPAGTMNLFARALGLPLDLVEALDAIAAGEVGAVDICTANDRPFVHQFGVGVHARLVRIREGMTYRSRIGKMLASLRAIGSAALRPPRFDADIHTRKGVERRTVMGIAVSNNPLGEGHIPHADTVDGGVLGVYIAAPVSTFELIKLAISVLIGRWRTSPYVSEKEVAELTLNFPKRKRGAQAVIDGELVRLDRTVVLKVHPGALQVLLPKVKVTENATR